MEAPQINFITFYRREGNFNILDKNHIEAQYIIVGIPSEIIQEKDLKISYTVELDYDMDFSPKEYTALELLCELEGICKREYFYSSDLKHIEKLKEYLESIEEEQEKLRHEYEIAYAKYQIEYWTQRLERLRKRV